MIPIFIMRKQAQRVSKPMYLIPKSHSYLVTDLGFEPNSVVFLRLKLFIAVFQFYYFSYTKAPLRLCPLPIPLALLVIPYSSVLNLNISFPERPLPKKDLYKIEPTSPTPPTTTAAKKDQPQSILPYCIYSLLQSLTPPKLILFIFLFLFSHQNVSSMR